MESSKVRIFTFRVVPYMLMKNRILLVDDEPLVLDSLREVLSAAEDHEVMVADSGRRALELIEHERFSVIITDLMLDDITGIDLLRSIKSRVPDTQVIMMSGKGTIDYAVEAMKMGAFDFITKPYSASHLAQILGRAKDFYASLAENRQLKGEIRRLRKNYDIIGSHRSMERIREIVRNVAPSDSTVLIQGRSGTGKELVARQLHELSARADGPFQAVNCGVFSETLIENELFGHEKGAYTGAVDRSIGRVEAASGGTLFLDEIDTMPLALQVKLLRVLEERAFHRVGGTRQISADFRLIAATNVILQEAVEKRLFRDDLFYRLNVISITLPELQERSSDIPLLVRFFMERFAGRSKAQTISPAAMDRILRYTWPGNVRELSNAVEYAMVMAQGPDIQVGDLPEMLQSEREPYRPAAAAPEAGLSLKDTERELIIRTLRDCRGNKHLTAKALKIPRSSLYSKLQKHGIVIDESSGEVSAGEDQQRTQ